jgi:2-(1,2-epoxy-1,2-dihydrophenyl)acetyl-CoA isomerase
MAEDELLVDRPAPGVVVLTLNRPERLNAVTLGLQRTLDHALSELSEDADVRCLILTGAGDRAFSAGYDVHEMAGWDADELLLVLLEREQLIWNVSACPLPIIAALNGVVYGVGAIMASAVDFRIGTAGTVWRFTAGEHGGANATWSLPGLVGRSRAAELLMTSRSVAAAEAERIGLLDRVVDGRDALLPVALELAEAIAANPPAATRAIKQLLREHVGRTVEDNFIAENLKMRTALRPRPVGELYADFLAGRERPDMGSGLHPE